MTDGGFPMMVPLIWRQNVLPNLNMLFYIMMVRAWMIGSTSFLFLMLVQRVDVSRIILTVSRPWGLSML